MQHKQGESRNQMVMFIREHRFEEYEEILNNLAKR